MSSSLQNQIEQLKSAIAAMEAQREALGDAVVEAALAPLQRRLEELTALLSAREETILEEPVQQRKLVTLLFMDIAGSTSIAQHMDPEDVSEVFDSTLKKLAAPVEEHSGRVTRFMGDGFLAVFGALQAHEDDPERAVRAGLQIIELSSELAAQLQTEWGLSTFQVRVGINTGLVLLGGQTEAQDTLMGAAVNLAARLESAAPPGGLLISHDTYRHVRGVFDVQPLEPVIAKGFDQPVAVYRVLRARPRAFRLYTRGVEGIETRMVGRETELKYLQDALLTAIEEGEGQMITISGEAGVGKSRLLYEFQDWIELLPPPPVRFFEGRAHLEAQGLPYALLRDLFAFRFQIQDNDSADAVREKLGAGFAEVFGTQADGEMRAHILGQWLGYDFSSSPHLVGVLNDAKQLHNRGLIYLGEYFAGLAVRAPVVIYLEDIHWADDSSLDAISWLGERLHSQRLLVVCAARPTLFERRPYWGEGQAHHTRLDLRPLSRRESRQLVEQILRLAQDIPPELRELVVDGAEGNPFYLEELIKMLIENGVVVKGEESWHIEPERLAQTEVPSTLAGVLQARLDSLPAPERTVLQQASVVGRLFWDRIVAYIQSAGEGKDEIVPDALIALRGRELIYRREESAFADAREYIFKHDILREVTYESVLKRLRKVYHGLVADWLVAQGTERAGEYYGLIAEHLLQAGRKEQASQYFTQAGEAALASYANGEAEANFRKALELSPDIIQRAACLAGLGETLARQGRREEAEQILRQAIDLYLEIGENDRTAYLYTRLSQMLWHGDYQKAWEASQEGLERLEGAAGSPGLAYLLAEAGRTAYFRARPKDEIVPLLNQAIEMASSLEIVGPGAEASITLALAEHDPTQGIEILKDAAVICEAHGLLRSAGRAHFNLGHFYSLSLGGADKSFQSYLKAAEIGRQMGDMDQMLLAFGNALESWAQLGNLKSEQDFSMDFLRKSGATQAQLDEFLQKRDPSFSYYRGNWEEPLEYARAELQKLRKGGSLQFISFYNSYVAESILEMQRFTGEGSFAEAEAALQENIDMHWLVNQSQYLLAIILARKGLFKEAHARLSEASAQPLNQLEEAQRLMAEAEIALAEGEWDQAVLACQSMINISQAGEYRWHWARTLINLGDAFQGRDGPDDRERAQETYRQSLEMFTEMGASGYIEVLRTRLNSHTDQATK